MKNNSLTYTTEDELIEKCIKRDANAQKALYIKFSAKLFAVSYRYSANKEDAKDVLQESFIKIFDHIKTFKKTGTLESWLKRIVVNTALSRYKKTKSTLVDFTDQLNENEIIDPVDEEQIEGDLLNLSEHIIMTHIQNLPEEYRMVFNLACIEELSHKEIATLLSIKEETSRIRLLRARKKLMESLTSINVINR